MHMYCGALHCIDDAMDGEIGVPLMTRRGNWGPLNDTMEKSGILDDAIKMGPLDDAMEDWRSFNDVIRNLGPWRNGEFGVL